MQSNNYVIHLIYTNHLLLSFRSVLNISIHFKVSKHSCPHISNAFNHLSHTETILIHLYVFAIDSYGLGLQTSSKLQASRFVVAANHPSFFELNVSPCIAVLIVTKSNTFFNIIITYYHNSNRVQDRTAMCPVRKPQVR